ncbi:helix-turn-helix domain-containing protein [Rugosimonospora africana]|uniref:ArsR family transcriptional regulator n=1 Tax=Rugosimonospora africana TaxID=556532 RepID=A0A8J3VSQ3_9ACTN|nr:helix-turn-helix domain-containing protein [Rugosimonospora africana]GIH17577.1 ArsR family transcriptional regulator [Rugosimonospora africana]
MAFDKQRRPATEREARALASSLRLRILRLCLDRPLTNKEIAARLDLNPATTLHHVRTLVATGFLAAGPERRGARGAREVPYMATGKSWTLDVRDSGVEGGSEAMIEAFLDEVRLVDEADRQLSRLGLRLDKKDIEELRERVADLLNEYASRPLDPEGEPYSAFVALYPDTSRE